MLASKLKKGDTVGLVAPSRSLKEKDREKLKNSIEYFENLGLKVKLGNYLFEEENEAAGTPKQRAKDINDMFCNDEVKAIFTAKGGNVANGILDYLDYEVIKQNPKIFLGMSDITVLLLAINAKCNLVTYHASDFIFYGNGSNEYDKQELVNRLFNANKNITCFDDRYFYNFSGNVSGKSLGTNMRTMLKLAGTEYLPKIENLILFLESFSLEPITCECMLEQMKQMKLFDNASAVVFGYIYGYQETYQNKYKIEDNFKNVYNKIMPMIKCNDFGHKHSNTIIPIGANIEINPNNKTIKIVDEFLI